MSLGRRRSYITLTWAKQLLAIVVYTQPVYVTGDDAQDKIRSCSRAGFRSSVYCKF